MITVQRSRTRCFWKSTTYHGLRDWNDGMNWLAYTDKGKCRLGFSCMSACVYPDRGLCKTWVCGVLQENAVSKKEHRKKGWMVTVRRAYFDEASPLALRNPEARWFDCSKLVILSKAGSRTHAIACNPSTNIWSIGIRDSSSLEPPFDNSDWTGYIKGTSWGPRKWRQYTPLSGRWWHLLRCGRSIHGNDDMS